MGRTRRVSGAYQLANAEELFRQSVAARKPNYELIALTIGEHPFDPPAWAVLECIELRGRQHRSATRGYDEFAAPHATRNILDEIARYYLEAELKHEEITGVSAWRTEVAANLRYRAAPLRQAIIAACRRLGTHTKSIGDASDDWFKYIRDAWDWEQKNDALVPREPGAGSHTSRETYHELSGWRVTRRIARVIEEVAALKGGPPADLEKALWILRQLQNHQNP